MSKVTHLSDVSALLRHAGVANMPYRDFSKPATPAAAAGTPVKEAAASAPPAAAASAEPVAAPAAAPAAAPLAPPSEHPAVPIAAAPVSTLDTAFDRLRRKTAPRRSPLAGVALSVPERAPVRCNHGNRQPMQRTWAEIWTRLDSTLPRHR